MLLGTLYCACGITEREVSERAADGGSSDQGTSGHAGGARAPRGGSTGSGGTASTGHGGSYPSGGTSPMGPGPLQPMPQGGKASFGGVGGMPPFTPECSLVPPAQPELGVLPLDCSLVPDIEPACPETGAGGAATDIGGAPSEMGGASADAGDGGTPTDADNPGGAADNPLVPWCGRPASTQLPSPRDGSVLLDDLEDGDDLTPPFLGGRGAWIVANDGQGQQYPGSCVLPSLLSFGAHAMHTYGKGFPAALGGYSLIGLSVKAGSDCSQPIDASGFTGVSFRARGTGWLRFFVGSVETNPPLDFGICSGGCYDAHGAYRALSDEWQLFKIPFCELRQEGWGQPAPFFPSHILALSWSAKQQPGDATPVSCFDFWIDDVAFYR